MQEGYENLGTFLNEVKSWTEVCSIYSDGKDLAEAEKEINFFGFNVVNSLEEYYSMDSHSGLYVPLYRMRDKSIINEWYDFAKDNCFAYTNNGQDKNVLGVVLLLNKETKDFINQDKTENILDLVGLTYNLN